MDRQRPSKTKKGSTLTIFEPGHPIRIIRERLRGLAERRSSFKYVRPATRRGRSRLRWRKNLYPEFTKEAARQLANWKRSPIAKAWRRKEWRKRAGKVAPMYSGEEIREQHAAVKERQRARRSDARFILGS